jgi:hypothetical protein
MRFLIKLEGKDHVSLWKTMSNGVKASLPSLPNWIQAPMVYFKSFKMHSKHHLELFCNNFPAGRLWRFIFAHACIENSNAMSMPRMDGRERDENRENHLRTRLKQSCGEDWEILCRFVSDLWVNEFHALHHLEKTSKTIPGMIWLSRENIEWISQALVSNVIQFQIKTPSQAESVNISSQF